MRVVQLNCVFNQGSTGKIVAAIHENLRSQGHESFVLYGLGSKVEDPDAIRVVPPLVRKAQSFRSRITGYPYGGALWGTHNTIKELKRLKPDIVHMHCYNAYIANIIKVLNFLKKEGIPTVITNHAEFMYTGGCTHALDCDKWLSGCGECSKLGQEHPISYFFDRTRDEWNLLSRAYDGFGNLTVCCVSDWVCQRAKQSPFFKQHSVKTVQNGVDRQVFHYRPCPSLRQSLQIREGQKIVLHVTPGFGSAIKGGSHVFEMAKRMPEILFVIVGNSEGIKSGLANVRLVGRVDGQSQLAEYYSAADVCLLTSKIETFSMVTAESLCCGTPVVGYKAGGPESIAIPEFSEFVPQGDDDLLEQSLKKFLAKKVNSIQISSVACRRYGQENMCKQYLEIYEELIQRP